MGQQVPFETLSDVARGLARTAPKPVHTITARTVRVGCDVVQRLEIEFEKHALPPIHVFEAYWAPLTEGAVGLWAVVRFLVAGGLNGLRSGGHFQRFLFGKLRKFSIGPWAIAELFLVLLLVLGLILIGIVVFVVGISALTFRPAAWTGGDLLKDLTSTFEVLLATLIFGGLASIVSIKLSGASRRLGWIRSLTLPVIFIVSAVVFLSAYIQIPLAFLFDLKMPFEPVSGCDTCVSSTGPDLRAYVGAFLRQVHELLKTECVYATNWVWWALFAASAAMLLSTIWWAGRAALPRKPAEDITDTHRNARGQWWGVVAAAVAFASVVAMCGRSEVVAFTTWIVLFAVVICVRLFLMQYLGDVAAYVSPHVVDRFFDLRNRIKDCVWRSARAVYALRDEAGNRVYDEVAIVGHSLGSVVVYDVLNRLINTDGVAKNARPGEHCDNVPVEYLDVETRTKLLLTFGSPLDKTAFIFAMHDRGGKPEREALAASVQPLIRRIPRKLVWVNVWSRWDIFSGPLEFYNDELPSDFAVKNERDPDALTLIAAHTEYWDHKLIYERIHQYL